MASNSSSVMLAQSSLGNASYALRAPGLIPQSINTLLSFVVNNIHDLPTCPKPPNVSNDTSDFCIKRSLKICSPIPFRCFALSAEETLS